MRFNLPLRELSKAFWASVPQEDLKLQERPRVLTPQNGSYLRGLCKKLEIKTVIEIGAGLSTLLMADVVESIKTCDRDKVSWDRPLENVTYTQAESTAFLKALEDPAELFFIDARLRKDDGELIANLSTEETIYLLDDFEGIEKGVANAFLLQEERLLITPVDGKFGRSTLAALIPKGLIRLTNQ